MASSNFNGLKLVYGDDVTDDVIGCEFHFQQSVLERQRKMEEDDGKQFSTLAGKMLKSATKTGYQASYESMRAFVEKHESLKPWLSWWHACRKNMFRAFTGQNKPFANQAEVIHASWVNRGDIGVTLRESAEFDTSDTLSLEERIRKFDMTKQVHLSINFQFKVLKYENSFHSAINIDIFSETH